jgi:hypothetical protein
MNIALLFDADGSKYDGNYYHAARRMVFATGIIQASQRHMILSVGDVIWERGKRSPEQQLAIRDAVLFDHDWGLLHEGRLRDTFGRSVVFTMVFENMTRSIAERLHAALSDDTRYLGLKQVSYEFGPHLVAFRTYVGEVWQADISSTSSSAI